MVVAPKINQAPLVWGLVPRTACEDLEGNHSNLPARLKFHSTDVQFAVTEQLQEKAQSSFGVSGVVPVSATFEPVRDRS